MRKPRKARQRAPGRRLGLWADVWMPGPLSATRGGRRRGRGRAEADEATVAVEKRGKLIGTLAQSC
jgi:hypothetical protein